MGKTPKKRSGKFKLNLVIEALKGEKTIVQLASENDTHPKQIQRWIKKLQNEGECIFTHKKTQEKEDPEKEDLLDTISELTRSLEFVKKKLKKSSH